MGVCVVAEAFRHIHIKTPGHPKFDHAKRSRVPLMHGLPPVFRSFRIANITTPGHSGFEHIKRSRAPLICGI
eukprot:5480015-Pyramimonas_sp.AAC.1